MHILALQTMQGLMSTFIALCCFELYCGVVSWSAHMPCVVDVDRAMRSKLDFYAHLELQSV